MFKGDRNFAVGLFVSVSLLALVAFIIWLTGRTGVQEMQRYTLLFDQNVGGLSVGGPVKYMGMNVGNVVQMKLEGNGHVLVRVDIDVLKDTPIDQGTYASLAFQGITGVAVVNLASEPGRHPPLTKQPGWEHPVIPVRDVGISAVLASAPEIMNKLDQLLSQAGELLGETNQEQVGETLKNVQALTGALAQKRDAIAALPEELSSTLTAMQATAGELQELVGQLGPNLTTTVENLRHSSESLAGLTARLDGLVAARRDDLDRFVSEGLGELPALMQEMRRTLRELNKLTATLSDNPSQLVHRPEQESLEIEP